MVAKPDLGLARERIRAALDGYFRSRGGAKVFVGINDYGRLHALIVSDSIEGKDQHVLREEVREFLRRSVGAGELAYLYGIHLLTSGEYDERRASASLGFFVEGAGFSGVPDGTLDD